MAKTLVIAEKPSVGRDLARALPGAFAKHEGYLEGPEQVITWAVGHLVQLAEPEEYDAKLKSWRMADLPIVPDRFKLVVRDERSRKQFAVVRKLLHREDVDEVINACDAGREGELIFAYLYESAKATKPVRRLWLSSMTQTAIKDAFANLRPAADLAPLEQAARSRSEADWIVGMNATRAATIRLRSSFDGAVSLGRVQTPTLAIVVRREQEIRAFKPEPYWLVDATFTVLEEGAPGERSYRGRYHAPAAARSRSKPSEQDGAAAEGEAAIGRGERIATEAQALAIIAACKDQQGAITKVEQRAQREKPPLLYDLTTLQREANSRFGYSARRTLAAAQRLYEEHKALTYPRTSSRYLSSDMVAEIKPTVGLLGAQSQYARAAAYVQSLDLLPLARVVNDAKVSDHHAIIPTRSEHPVAKMSTEERRVYDLVVRRFLAVFHPEAVFESTRVETVVGEHRFRTSGRLLREAGWRAVYGELDEEERERRRARDREAEVAEAAAIDADRPAGAPSDGAGSEGEAEAQQRLPRLSEGEQVRTSAIECSRKETKPPRRYSDASLLAAMETAGKLVEDEELREAMKDSGIGTPATRAAIIERLIDVGYLERDGRALVPTEKGMNVIALLASHALTSPDLTGDWERRLTAIEQGADSRERFMADIASFARETVGTLDETLQGVRIPRARLGPCPVCGREIVENRKGYSCWSREDPGCGFVIWKSKAGKQLPVSIARELIKTGYTAAPVSGFRGRSGRSFRARLALHQEPEGRWRVEFNEPWAKEGAKPPEELEEQAAELSAERSAA
ncbi:MAG TPA: DNA topoisomerase 3 [Solirubrobacteraceae bacterium]|nr:DNA topoisomerase 3 [Solirubrobacteraceae bacterium]